MVAASARRSAPVLGRSNTVKNEGMDLLNVSARIPLLRPGRAHSGGFTMIEIALCLAIIGFALVSIMLVLPSGMNTQRETREETIISQDASMLLEAVRSGMHNLDDLTNNVYLITNYWARYNSAGAVIDSGKNGYTRDGSTIPGN